MSGSHILVHSLNSIGSCHLAVLLVHVVGTRARIVSDPDTEVLDLHWALLVDNVQADDLSVRLLDLAELHQEVPETRLCNHGVGCKILIRYNFGAGFASEGRWRPMTWYSVRRPIVCIGGRCPCCR